VRPGTGGEASSAEINYSDIGEGAARLGGILDSARRAEDARSRRRGVLAAEVNDIAARRVPPVPPVPKRGRCWYDVIDRENKMARANRPISKSMQNILTAVGSETGTAERRRLVGFEPWRSNRSRGAVAKIETPASKCGARRPELK